MSPSVQLRPYQVDTIDAIQGGQQRGLKRMMVSSPTGSGKAVVSGYIANTRKQPTILLAHREELIDQGVEKIRMLNPDADVGVVKAERDEHDHHIVVASIPTLAREERLRRLPAKFRTVIIDEAHHAAAKTYRNVLDHLGCFGENPPLTIGMTATPVRGDGVGLEDVFEEIVFEASLLDLIQQGYLSDLRAIQVKLARANYQKLHSRAGDYVDAESGAMLSAANAPSHVVNAWRINAADRPTIVFTPTVALAEEMVQAFTEKGVTAAVLSGETPSKQRKAVLEQFRRGEVQVIANAALLTEGVDLPLVSCIVIAKPTKSQVCYSQMVGRGLRRYPGKDDCLVIDVIGSTLDLELQTVSTLTGLPADSLDQRGATVRGVLQEQSENGLTTQQTPDGRLIVVPIDLLGSGLNWIPTGEGSHILSAGDSGTLALVPAGEAWRVVQFFRDKWTQPRVLHNDVSLEWGMGVAEDFVRNECRAGALADRAAAWRVEEPTEKQIKFLKVLGIPKRAVKGKSKGEVSDLITAAQATRQLAEVA